MTNAAIVFPTYLDQWCQIHTDQCIESASLTHRPPSALESAMISQKQIKPYMASDCQDPGLWYFEVHHCASIQRVREKREKREDEGREQTILGSYRDLR